MLECRNGHFYTGITTDVQKRFDKHAAGKGAKYTRANPPEKIIYREQMSSEQNARSRECEIKSLNRSQKEKLIKQSKQLQDNAAE